MAEDGGKKGGVAKVQCQVIADSNGDGNGNGFEDVEMEVQAMLAMLALQAAPNRNFVRRRRGGGSGGGGGEPKITGDQWQRQRFDVVINFH
uniref:HDC10507 n=1 Tax=Drosophila melanogaster TaxID=7227 RepID=Q6IL34_DROME|nr:TPA_inf: HDC10507 [Drosophila melanogaster]